MHATLARRKATDFNTKEIDSQFSVIMKMIEGAVNKGEYECYVYNVPIKQSVKEKLESLGYTIGKTESDRNETLTKISW